MTLNSGAEVERRPLASNVPGSSPVMNEFWLCEYWLSLQEADIERD